MHSLNERNFPQTKLASKINVSFLLNEHGELIVYFLSHNNRVLIILFNLKNKKILSDRKKGIGESVRMQIMTAKTTTIQRFTSTSF